MQLKKPPARRNKIAIVKLVDSPKPITDRQELRLLITTMGLRPILSETRPHGKDEMNCAAQKEAACECDRRSAQLHAQVCDVAAFKIVGCEPYQDPCQASYCLLIICIVRAAPLEVSNHIDCHGVLDEAAQTFVRIQVLSEFKRRIVTGSCGVC